MTDGTTTWSYVYDANGMRTSRTNGTKTYNYVYNGSQLTQMTVGNDTLFFTYGALGPNSVTWNGTTYYYSLNAQGDVVGIFDDDGKCLVSYNWDNVWGYNPVPEGRLADTLGVLNPLRYRGYVYDTETGYYYLQSRYYDPEIGRFINADAFASTGQGFIGHNMFAYCLNNPVNTADDGGYSADDFFGWLGELIGVFIYETITGDDHPQQQIDELEVQIIQEQNEMIADAADATWDAYMRGYNLKQEEIMLQARSNVDMFDSPEDIERSIDVIDATVGFSTVSYELATIIITPTPISAKAVVLVGVGLIWGIRGVLRALQ